MRTCISEVDIVRSHLGVPGPQAYLKGTAQPTETKPNLVGAAYEAYPNANAANPCTYHIQTCIMVHLYLYMNTYCTQSATTVSLIPNANHQLLHICPATRKQKTEKKEKTKTKV